MSTLMLSIPPSGQAQVIEVPGETIQLEPLQQGVGGYVQALGLARDLIAWLNEDGVSLGLPINIPASALVYNLTGQAHRLHGTVLLTGGADSEGETLGLSPEQVAQFGGWRRVSIPQEEVLSWESQVVQYPYRGEPGIGYFPGPTPYGVVHCLLWRDDHGLVRGILNYYDFQAGIWEKPGNVNIFVHRQWKRRRIGTALYREAKRRWPTIALEDQRYTPEGLAFSQWLEGQGDR